LEACDLDLLDNAYAKLEPSANVILVFIHFGKTTLAVLGRTTSQTQQKF